MDLLKTEIQIKQIKDFFEKKLAKNLNLYRVSAPMFLRSDSGLNDELNTIEQPIRFTASDNKLEIIHSLAKWKRKALDLYKLPKYSGLYTDMNAIRKDDLMDNIHSIYVDQWDWELHIDQKDRKLSFLKKTVKKIYKSILDLNKYIEEKHHLSKSLPKDIFFITSQELENLYPDKTPKEREYLITKEHKAVFIIGIGGKLKSGIPHDTRSYDYDDWKLNGDILVYYDVLDIALELSSMGIRVDEKALLKQAKILKVEDRLNRPYQQSILNKELPYSIGGGIGQSRLCMYFLNKKHIGEVQNSFWTDEEIERLKKENIFIDK